MGKVSHGLRFLAEVAQCPDDAWPNVDRNRPNLLDAIFREVLRTVSGSQDVIAINATYIRRKQPVDGDIRYILSAYKDADKVETYQASRDAEQGFLTADPRVGRGGIRRW